MKAYNFLIFILVFVSCRSSAQSNTAVRADYKSALDSALRKINTIEAVELGYLMPVNNAESIIFYSSDYDQNVSKNFALLQQKLVELCLEGNVDILTGYLHLSQYVDGYFAEDYFDNIEKIAQSDRDLFCRILKKVDKEKTKRLLEIRAKYCK